MKYPPPRRQKTYDEFVADKTRRVEPAGIDVGELNPLLFEWQQVIVRHALKLGRAALFEDCGLGKAIQQLEWAKKIHEHTGEPVIILAPVNVANQTAEIEAVKFGYDVKRVYSAAEVVNGINITNYERLHLFDSCAFSGVVLDESSILKSFDGKTRQILTDRFASTAFRLACTATPSPNDFTELGQHAEFLGICTRMQMLATYFINDTYDTGDWRIKKHAVEEFWRWVSSWAVCISKPSDIGFSDEGFALPDLNIIPVWVETDETGGADGNLFRVADTSAMAINKEMRRSIAERGSKCLELISDSSEQWSVWVNLNDEQDEIEKLLGHKCVSVRGADSEKNKIDRERSWRLGEAQTIVSKGSIFGFGSNWQHCHNAIVFPTYSHEDFYQIVRRFYRFGQKSVVNCYVVLPRTADNILRTLNKKAKQHETMREMTRYTRENLMAIPKPKGIKTTITERKGDNWTMYHGDCVRVARTFAAESIDFSVFSPPFADLFTYSSDAQDMGNCNGLDEFMAQFGFLVDELARVLVPGREVAVHCCDLLATKWKDGDIEFKNFSDIIYRAFHQRGFLFHSRVCIWKSPVTEMQRTKAHGLLYKTLQKDSSSSRVGSADYLLVFRKRGVNPKPITHSPDDLPLSLWQEIASPVWMTVDQGKVLNGECARDVSDERHICPLQLDVISRALTLWSAKGDLVFSPFAGIGSEGFESIKMGRRFVGSELKQSYFEQACVNLETAIEESNTLL